MESFASHLLGLDSHATWWGSFADNASVDSQIADFGLAAIRADPDELLKTECGTRSYMAPEILGHQEYDGAKVSSG